MPDMLNGLPACAYAIAKPMARFSCTWKTASRQLAGYTVWRSGGVLKAFRAS